MLKSKERRRIRLWALWLPLLWLQMTPYLAVQAKEKEALRVDEILQLGATTQKELTLHIPQTGEYTLESTGTSAVNCTLLEPWRGVLATANSGTGEAKNCRFDGRLHKGTYRLLIEALQPQATNSVEKQPVVTLAATKLSLRAYKGEDAEALLAGKEERSTLEAGKFLRYRVEIPARQKVEFSALGATVSHCRLLGADGWSTALTASAASAGLHNQDGQWQRCLLQGMVDAGVYSFVVFGRASQPSAKGRSVTSSNVFTRQGTAYIKPSASYKKLQLHTDGQYQLGFTLARSAHPEARLLFQANSRGQIFATLYQIDPNGHAIRRGGCYTRKLTPFSFSTCQIESTLATNQRYEIHFRGGYGAEIRTRYQFFPMARSPLALNQRIAVHNQDGDIIEYPFEIRKQGTYQIESQQIGRSCLLQRADKLGDKGVIDVQGLTWGDQPRQTTQEVGRFGLTEWIKIPTSGVLTLEASHHEAVTCSLATLENAALAENTGKSCRVAHPVKAGIYRLHIRPARSNEAQSVRWSRRFEAIPRPKEALAYRPSHCEDNKPCDNKIACSIRQELSPGRYILRLGNFGTPRQGSIGLFTYPLKKTHKRPARSAFFVYTPSRRTPPAFTATPLVLGQTSFHTLRPQGSAYFSLQIAEAGLYRIHSQGLLRLRCALQHEAEAALFSQSENEAGGNCALTQYLPAGAYRVVFSVLGESHGRFGVTTQQIKHQEGQPLASLERAYARLNEGSGRSHKIHLAHTTDYKLQLFSHDAPVAFRLEDAAGWPRASGQLEAWSGKLHQGSYRLLLFPSTKPLRYRAMIYPSNQAQAFWPISSIENASSAHSQIATSIPRRSYHHRARYRAFRRYRHTTPSTSNGLNAQIATSVLQGQQSPIFGIQEIKTKGDQPHPLPLYGRYRVTLSPLGADVFTLDIPASLKLELTLSQGFSGKIFLQKETVAALKGGKNTLSLRQGTHRIAIQEESGKTGVPYEIGLHVLESAPSIKLWRTVPSTLILTLDRPTHITLQTEGDPDTWCKLSDAKTQRPLLHNDDLSPERWDCKLDASLPAGRYALQIDGFGQGTWLSVQSSAFQAAAVPKSATAKAHSYASTAQEHAPVSLAMTLPAGKTQEVKLTFPKEGLYRIEAHSKEHGAWGCALGEDTGAWPLPQSDTLRCLIVRHLKAGDHTLQLWRPQRAQIASEHDIMLSIQALQLPSVRFQPWPSVVTTQKIPPQQAQRFKLPAWEGVTGSLVLQGEGSAFLLDEKGRSYASCDAHPNTRSCLITVPLKKQAFFLHLQAGKSGLRALAALRETHAAHTPVLTLHQSHHWPSDASRVLRFQSPQARKGTTLHIQGASQCRILFGQGHFKETCRLTFDQDSTHPLLIQIQTKAHRAGRITLAHPQAYAKALWSAPLPDAPKIALPLGGSAIPLQGNAAFFLYETKENAALHFEVKGQAVTCALGKIGQMPLFASQNKAGCRLVKPLAAGRYWIGVRAHHTSLSTQAFAQQRPIHALKEGRHEGFFLAHDLPLVFSFKAEKDRKIGIAAISDHEEARCNLYDHAMRKLAKGCQHYGTLPQGEVFFVVSLPAHAEAAATTLVLRGLAPPPKDAPIDYLRRMTRVNETP